MTHDRPTALELLEAVTEFLAGEVAPAVEDQRLRFRTLVALNALGIAYRELAAERLDPRGTVQLAPQELADLASRIRAGEAPDGVHALLKEHVAAKLRISNPRALEKYK